MTRSGRRKTGIPASTDRGGAAGRIRTRAQPGADKEKARTGATVPEERRNWHIPRTGQRAIDASRPNVARMYDYVLGGKDNFRVDRQAAERIIAAAPDIADVARQNREFLKRAVECVAVDGVAQFIDIGCGLPTAENTHQIAQRVIPAARVVYVDNDPMAVAHAMALLADNMNVIAIDGDLRDPGAILADPGLKSLVDLSHPVAIILTAVLHFVASPLAGEVVNRLKRSVPQGSYLVISHATTEQVSPEELEVMRKECKDASSPVTGRRAAEVAQFFDGFELVRPGVVNIEAWRNTCPRDAAARIICYGGAARKGKAPEGCRF